MAASALLEAVVPKGVMEKAHRLHHPHDNHRRASHQKAGDSRERRSTSDKSNGTDDFEQVEREQSYEHVSHPDGRTSSVPSFIEEFEQISRPLTPNEITRDPSEKHIGGSVTDLSIRDFQLIKTIGTGTFARVWLAKLNRGNKEQRERVFALKVLRKVDIIRLKQVEHVQNERTTLGAVAGHPFITSLILTFKDLDSLYMLLDYCPGGEVFTYLRRARRFDEPTARFYAAEIVLVFEFLHEIEGIAYRDLKPENILLDANGHIKLVDFGFAKKIGDKQTYTLCGTPEYLAPEVIKNTGHGTGTDWWALGILIYEFLVGQPPFWDQNPMKIYHMIVEGNLRFPQGVRLSDEAKDVITQLCQAQPSQRLGCVAGGAAKVKSHPWFAGTDYEALYYKRIQGPIVPQLSHAADSTNFDEYPDEDVAKRREYSDHLKHKFDSKFNDF